MPRAAVTTDRGRVELRDVQCPEPEPDEVALCVEAVGICGTDLHIFDGSYATELPQVQGHEISAVVDRLPSGYHGALEVGARVAVEPVISCGTCFPCRRGRRNTCSRLVGIGVHRPGGFQQRLVVPAANCHLVPPGLSPEVTALCETMSVSLHAVTRASVTAADTVLVLGAGPIGLGAVVAARDAGASVMVMDQHDTRLGLASELGADEVVRGLDALEGRVARWTDGDGAAVVVEATGVAVVAEHAFELAATAGRISMVGVSEDVMRLSTRVFQRKELDVFGSRATLDFPAAVELARRHVDDLRRLVSHHYPLEDTQQALELAHDHPQQVMKVLVDVS